jgi:hypothetical protein
MDKQDGSEAAGKPLDQDRDGPLAELGWHGGATFFEHSGGRPAKPAGQALESGQGTGGGDPHLPASEAGGGIIPEDEGTTSDVHAPASEADEGGLQDDRGGEPQSWPGKSFGSIPPPG